MNGAGRGTRADLVDRVLDGKDPETKARVLDLIYRLRLEPTDELFLFCVAIGYLETIVTDAPEQWQAVFTSFHTNLEQWKNNHLRTLETSADLTEQVEEMTRTLTRQTTHTSDLAKGLRVMLRQSETMTEQLPDLARMLKTFSKKLDGLSEGSDEQTNQLKREMKRLTGLIQDMEKASTAPAPAPNTRSGYTTPGRMFPTPFPMNEETLFTPTSNGSRAASVLLALSLIVTSATCYTVFRQQQTLDWLLFKANRLDCKQGIVAANSRQCAAFK